MKLPFFRLTGFFLLLLSAAGCSDADKNADAPLSGITLATPPHKFPAIAAPAH